MYIVKRAKQIFSNSVNSDDHRSKKVLKNIFFSIGIRGGSIIVSFLLVPLSISYLSATYYGVWLTITSVVNWLSFFDIGLANGLRNKLSDALARDDIKKARKYVSTTYVAMLLISTPLAIALIFFNNKINWANIFNVTSLYSNNSLQLVMCIVILTFLIQFVINVINSILTAVHEPAMANLITFTTQVFVLVGVLVLAHFTEPNIIYLVCVSSLTPIAVITVISVILFKTKLKYIAPSISSIDFKYFKTIINTGGGFFLVQIGALVLFQTDNFIITRVLGASAVTEFNVAFKLYSVITMINAIIVSPYWSAYTDAWAKQDFEWMQKSIKRLRKVWLILSFFAIVIYIASPIIFKLWLGEKVSVSGHVSFALLLYTIVICFQSVHNYVINGIGKIRLQIYLMLFSSVFNIPLSIFLAKQIGLAGVIYSNIFFMLILSLAFYRQTNKLIFKSL